MKQFASLSRFAHPLRSPTSLIQNYLHAPPLDDPPHPLHHLPFPPTHFLLSPLNIRNFSERPPLPLPNPLLLHHFFPLPVHAIPKREPQLRGLEGHKGERERVGGVTIQTVIEIKTPPTTRFARRFPPTQFSFLQVTHPRPLIYLPKLLAWWVTFNFIVWLFLHVTTRGIYVFL